MWFTVLCFRYKHDKQTRYGPRASLNMPLTFFHWPDVSVIGKSQSDVIITNSSDTFLSLVFQLLRFPLLDKQVEINILSF